jgi:16S rRNA processing protein RimM
MTAGRVLIGRILKAHGIHGEVTFLATGDDPGSLRPGLVAYLSESGGETGGETSGGRGGEAGGKTGDEPGDKPGDKPGDESLTVRAARAGYRSWLLSFDEVTDRNAAESLAGRSLFIEEASLPPLPEGEYYQFQLVGRVVTRSDGNELGRVSRVIDMPGHDLLEVQGALGEFLVPMRREFVEWIDLERGEIRLADRADLLEAQSKAATPPFEGTAGSAGQGRGNPAQTRRRRPRSRRPRSRRLQPDQSSESAS